MYVCICKAVTDSEIRAAAADGAASLRDLREQLGVASQCGRCARDARCCLNEACAEHAADQALSQAGAPCAA